MGALTLKTFPFELRSWDIEKFDWFDLTDSFGSNLKISLNNKKIIQIEPGYDLKNSIWIHDKARQFFDSLTSNNINNFSNLSSTVRSLTKALYLFELCNFKYSNLNYFIIVYDNLSIDNLCLLTTYSQKYSFIKLKKSENVIINNNIETDFLFNKKVGFNTSSLCLLISNNIRYEASVLNLNLKQKFLKGNFKLFNIGSFVNLTFNVKFLGKTSTKILKAIVEGTHFICQDFKFAKNPFIIINTEIFKINENLNKLLVNLNSKISLNVLNSTVFEVSSHFLSKTKMLHNFDFLNFSSIFFINLTNYNNNIISKLLKINIIFLNKHVSFLVKKILLEQNFYKNIKNIFKQNNLNKYIYLPTKTFFETKEKFLNNEGFIKNTNILTSNLNKFKSSWKIIRSIFTVLKRNDSSFIQIKNNFKINLNFKNLKFKVFNYLLYEASKNLNNLKTFNNVNSFFLKKSSILKIKKIKFINSKMKLWLNDFYIGGKDILSKNSLIMIKLSKISRTQTTNFF